MVVGLKKIYEFSPSVEKNSNLKCILGARFLNINLEVRISEIKHFSPLLRIKEEAGDILLVEEVLDIEEEILIPALLILNKCRVQGVVFPLDDSPYSGSEYVSYDEGSSCLEVYCQLIAASSSRGSQSSRTSLNNKQVRALEQLEHGMNLLSRPLSTARHPFVNVLITPTLASCLAFFEDSKFPNLRKLLDEFRENDAYEVAVEQAVALAQSQTNALAAPSLPATVTLSTAKLESVEDASADPDLTLDWTSSGLISTLKLVFSQAILKAFPLAGSMQSAVEPSVSSTTASAGEEDIAATAYSRPPEVSTTTLDQAILARCKNTAFGDFQCNNAIAISQGLRKLTDYNGPKSPKDVANAIIAAMPRTSLISSVSAAPSGFINIQLSTDTLVQAIRSVVLHGAKAPSVERRRVLVDFSSPNIAKEMHVGHLRSTIIGDAVCRVLEYLGHDVMRVNHVGDWGTQFGMLITFLQEEYPDILNTRPNITDLNVIYKAAKSRFDQDEGFKETSRLNVVKLQSGDPGCRSIWTLLCDISRTEFQKVYDRLGVRLEEYGESFYNPYIPAVIEELKQGGHLIEENGMWIAKQEGYTIPLILRKSDGGYGYDSTDMTALKYRLENLKRDWLIYITDAGQATHFYMCFDLARKAGWVQQQRLDHIGFGVVCGEDNKRFKSRSGDTVRLVDLLDASKSRMEEQLTARAAEGKTPLEGADIAKAASSIGYGAVKYFDLKQNPVTNYVFSYDRMLDTRGDTAVYLLFSYARISSILRKAKDDKGVDVKVLAASESSTLNLSHASERALAFEVLQFADVLRTTANELGPNRLCDYIKDLSVRATEFITKCQVLNSSSDEQSSRLQLCEAVRVVMSTCFTLLGIEPLERI